jgi:hypothetical protein
LTDEILVKGPVLGPGWTGRPELGLTDRPLTEKEIQKAAFSFLENNPFDSPLIDKQHEFITKGSLVENFVTSQDYEFNGHVYPPGTWFITTRVSESDMVQGVQDGTYTGFSVSAWPESKRGLLEQKIAENGLIAKGLFNNTKEGEWLPIAVSIAKLPFYPEAVFKVFSPDEIIKKNIENLEVDNLSDGDNALAGFAGKLLDLVINKEAKTEEVKTELTDGPKFVTEEMLDSKLDAQYKKFEELVNGSKEEAKEDKKEEAKSDSKEDKEEDKKEEAKTDSKEDKKKESKDAKKDKEEDEDSKETDDAMISKAIKIDDVKQGKNGKKTFMEECGLDPMGRNPKYL